MKNLPDKIYILQHEDYSDRRIFNAFSEKESNTDVEYVRKDVFAEKAYEFLNKYISEIEQFNPILKDYEVIDVHCKYHDSKKDFIEDFKKYMED